MKQNRSIEITVSPLGDISIEAVAFKGADCEAATKFLEEALGTTTRRSRKPEFHQRASTKSKQRLGS